ncbi:MAG: hypothetical protein AAF909_02660 [Pseudomonadota bacterium]
MTIRKTEAGATRPAAPKRAAKAAGAAKSKAAPTAEETPRRTRSTKRRAVTAAPAPAAAPTDAEGAAPSAEAPLKKPAARKPRATAKATAPKATAPKATPEKTPGETSGETAAKAPRRRKTAPVSSSTAMAEANPPARSRKRAKPAEAAPSDRAPATKTRRKSAAKPAAHATKAAASETANKATTAKAATPRKARKTTVEETPADPAATADAKPKAAPKKRAPRRKAAPSPTPETAVSAAQPVAEAPMAPETTPLSTAAPADEPPLAARDLVPAPAPSALSTELLLDPTEPADVAPLGAVAAEPLEANRRFASALAAKDPKVVLFTTTSGDAAAEEMLARMIDGLRMQAGSGAILQSFVLVQQNAALTKALRDRLDPPHFVTFIAGGGRMSLSAARNKMLSHAFEHDLIAPDDVVAFPDDDSWYPAELLSKIQYLFASDPFFDFFFCRYASTTDMCLLSRCAPGPTAQTVISNASSNTIFVRGRLAVLLGGFDETLGVGAKHRAGEDLDYAIRAFLGADQSSYLDAALVGHRDKDPKISAKYFGGSLLVLSRYGLLSRALLGAFLRKLGVGGLFMLTGRLGPANLFRSITVALGQFGRSAS